MCGIRGIGIGVVKGDGMKVTICVLAVVGLIGLCVWMYNRACDREHDLFVLGYDGALLAISRGADANVVWASSQGPGLLNAGARAAAKRILGTA